MLLTLISARRLKTFQMGTYVIRQWRGGFRNVRTYFGSSSPFFNRRSISLMEGGSFAPGLRSDGSGRPDNTDSPDGSLHGTSTTAWIRNSVNSLKSQLVRPLLSCRTLFEVTSLQRRNLKVRRLVPIFPVKRP